MVTVGARMGQGLSGRWATAADAIALWDFYVATGFLYPEKLRALPDGGELAKGHLRKLLELPSVYRVALTSNPAGEIISACTAAQFSDNQSWVMHLASKRNRLALLAAISEVGEATLTLAPRVAYTFTSTNVGVAALFSSLGDHGDLVERQTYDYFLISPEWTPPRDFRSLAAGHDLELRDATAPDFESLLSELQGNQRAALEAAGPFPASESIVAVSTRLQARGLVRERRAVAVTLRGHLHAICVMDLSPYAWNFSHLGTGLQVFASAQCDNEALMALILYASDWFRLRAPLGHWTALISSTDVTAMTAMASLGLSSTKSYVRIGVPATLGPAILNNYKQRLSLRSGTHQEVSSGVASLS